ncbi:MAG: hypothetical protein K6T67_05660, partial [Alicyclobacillus sp.]|nr:hypothetical protein [Alicyclobacillus sp.]
CADGWLVLDEVQPEGRRRMPAEDWWRGLHRDVVRFDATAPVDGPPALGGASPGDVPEGSGRSDG